MVISEKHKYLFGELPRTGTTSIRNILIEKFDGEGDMDKNKRHISISNYIRRKNIKRSDFQIFACVRNPMDRTLSHYLKMKKDHNNYFTRLENKEKRSFSENLFLKRYWDIKNNNLSFEDYFLKYYKLPYSDWMYMDYKLCDHIIKFENLSDDFNAIVNELVNPEEQYSLPQKNVIQDKANFITYYNSNAIQRRAQKIFGIYMKKFNYPFPLNWPIYKLTIIDKLSFFIINLIKATYWKYLY